MRQHVLHVGLSTVQVPAKDPMPVHHVGELGRRLVERERETRARRDRIEDTA
jgi:hypothetical protein